jgi:hypothetical protein
MSAWETYLYYGQSPLQDECEFDLLEILLQPTRSSFYNRKMAAGIQENKPNGIELQVMGRFNIANSIAYRNSRVTIGLNGTKDRRIGVSQNTIGFDTVGSNLDITVLYFMFANYETPVESTFKI